MLFVQIHNVNIMYPNQENMIVLPLAKRKEIIMSIKVCLVSQMSINYKEHGGEKSFFC